jgi:hypothetical protein
MADLSFLHETFYVNIKLSTRKLAMFSISTNKTAIQNLVRCTWVGYLIIHNDICGGNTCARNRALCALKGNETRVDAKPGHFFFIKYRPAPENRRLVVVQKPKYLNGGYHASDHRKSSRGR